MRSRSTTRSFATTCCCCSAVTTTRRRPPVPARSGCWTTSCPRCRASSASASASPASGKSTSRRWWCSKPMSEKVLSQDEMDALMDGVSSGKVEVQTDTGTLDAEVYDYEIPARNQIRRGSLPRLDHLNRQLARRMERTLMRQLRVETRVVTRTIETLRFETVRDGFPTPPPLMLLAMKPLSGPALMFLDPPLINALVDRYFGGANGNECRSDREGYTPGEVRISEIVMSRFLENMKEVGRPVLELEPEIVQTESDLQQLQVAAPNDAVVKCEFGVEPGESSGRIQLILPLDTIQPVFDSLDGAERSAATRRTRSGRARCASTCW